MKPTNTLTAKHVLAILKLYRIFPGVEADGARQLLTKIFTDAKLAHVYATTFTRGQK